MNNTQKVSDKVRIGKKFGRLTVVGAPFVTIVGIKNGQKNTMVVSLCCCGEYHAAKCSSLISGNTKSCGCRIGNHNARRPQNKTHGDSKSRLYRIWSAAKYRCHSQGSRNYSRYGGKGITMCDAWRSSYSIFRDWALATGYTNELTLDRVDSRKGYCPANCQWLTLSDNSKKVVVEERLREEKQDLTIDALTACLIAML